MKDPTNMCCFDNPDFTHAISGFTCQSAPAQACTNDIFKHNCPVKCNGVNPTSGNGCIPWAFCADKELREPGCSQNLCFRGSPPGTFDAATGAISGGKPKDTAGDCCV